MSTYPNFNGYNNGAQACRTQDKVVVYVSPRQPVPDMVPYELHEHVFPDDWHSRVLAIRDLAFRYYHPMIERLWLIIASLAVIIIPIALYQVIFNALYENQLPHTAEHFYRARAVSFAVFIGTFVVFWAPMLIWKALGKRRLRKLTQGWEKVDRAAKPPSAFVPVWKANMPTIFKSTCIVTITTPLNARPTLFHPNAYLPSYINPPVDAGADAAYYYPYAPGQTGLPRMSVAGTLPSYQAEPGKDKYFEDVKV
ncbi:hypothetical protein ACEPAG_7667 [Sanghuangporus baumii]